MKLLKIAFVLIACLMVMTVSCKKKEERLAEVKKISVITTLFPLYEFANNVGGGYADVFLILPPGVEAHGFDPTPQDIMKINNAHIFVYTGKHMEPWAEKILKGIDNKSLIIVDSSANIKLMKEVAGDGHAHNHKHSNAKEHGMDPHIWLDLDNAQKMVDTILDGFIKADPANADVYRKNAEQYKIKLATLDNKFREGLASCRIRYFIHGGHYAFGYMATRYGLNYISAYPGFSPDSEPSVKQLAQLVKKMRRHNIKHVFYEELISPRVAETIAKETGATLLQLHAAHNVSKEEWDRKVTFIALMEQNLENLRIALQCK